MNSYFGQGAQQAPVSVGRPFQNSFQRSMTSKLKNHRRRESFWGTVFISFSWFIQKGTEICFDNIRSWNGHPSGARFQIRSTNQWLLSWKVIGAGRPAFIPFYCFIQKGAEICFDKIESWIGRPSGAQFKIRSTNQWHLSWQIIGAGRPEFIPLYCFIQKGTERS